jgi:hypothetical protein
MVALLGAGAWLLVRRPDARLAAAPEGDNGKHGER